MIPTIDHMIGAFDNALRSLSGIHPAQRENPAQQTQDAELSESERQHVAGLMRVNHVGEICAQALYQGQALTAHDDKTRRHMLKTAHEENDHLKWCQQRLNELDSRTSLLNPLWYLGSFVIGAGAGITGNGWNLGFLVETERQVEAHLNTHLDQIPPQDERSRIILETMKEDEVRHAQEALYAGARILPVPIKRLLKLTSKIMTITAYRI